ncbi:MAG: 3'-5' exonuclease, partial [Candidatus Thorarchaeota archaeon]
MEKDKRPEDDSQSSLEDFFDSSEVDESEEPSEEPLKEDGLAAAESQIEQATESHNTLSEEEDTEDIVMIDETEETVSELRVGERETPTDLAPSYLLSVDYAGAQRKAFARLYNPDDKRIYFWFDNTGHQPYCYTDYPVQIAEQKIGRHGGFIRSEEVELVDLLRDEPVKMTKVIAGDPLSIGGSAGAIRDRLVDTSGDQTISHAWEAAIRYRNCYTYDTNIVSGLPYRIEKGNLVPSSPELDKKLLKEFKSAIGAEDGTERLISEYAPMLFTEVPDIRRIAIDIEVYTPVKNRIPDARTAPYEVIAIGLSDNEGYNKCFLLKRAGVSEGPESEDYPSELEIVYYDDEKDMIVDAFKTIDTYPIVLTFVGDAFDLNYLYHRAERIGID